LGRSSIFVRRKVNTGSGQGGAVYFFLPSASTIKLPTISNLQGHISFETGTVRSAFQRIRSLFVTSTLAQIFRFPPLVNICRGTGLRRGGEGRQSNNEQFYLGGGALLKLVGLCLISERHWSVLLVRSKKKPVGGKTVAPARPLSGWLAASWGEALCWFPWRMPFER